MWINIRRRREDREKVITYLRSPLFPWNFLLEDVSEESVKHFIPYAIQVCEWKGIERGAIGNKDAVKGVITKEVREAVNNYLLDTGVAHGKFTSTYPFAFSQCLLHTILYRLGLELGDVVDVKAVSDLLGKDRAEIERRAIFFRDLIERNKAKAARMFGRFILDKRVITADGDYIGTVGDIVFDVRTGDIEGLVVNNHQRGSNNSRVSMQDVRLNMYSKNIVLKNSEYQK